MNETKKYSMKISFMVEPLQQLYFRENQNHSKNLEIQADAWESTIHMMLDQGHDVQLHLHPQWFNAKLKDDYFHLNKNWNIATYQKSERREMIEKGIELLNTITKKGKEVS